MSLELVLMRVDPSNEGLGVIDLCGLIDQRLRDLGQPAKLALLSPDGGSFHIELPGGTAAVDYDHARIPILELDDLTMRVIFSIVQAGRMVAITEGGKYPVILTDNCQRPHLPEVEWQNPEQSPVCKTSSEFRRQIQGWFKTHRDFTRRVFSAAERKVASNEAGAVDSIAEENLGDQQSEKPGIFMGAEWRSDVFLHHFNQSGYNAPKHEKILSQLANAARQVLGEQGTVVAKDEYLLKIELPTGSGSVRAHGAIFDLSDVDLLTCAVLLQIAEVGGMAVLTRKPKGVQTILTDRNQLPLMPSGWNTAAEFCSICRDPKQLMDVLRYHLELDAPIDQRATFGAHTPEPLPGTEPIVTEVVYLEVKPPNTPASKHQDKLYRFISRECRSRRDSNKLSGLLGTYSRQLITPEQKVFSAYSYTAGCSGWLELVRKFAALSDLLTAQIVNFDTFTQDDGVSFAVNKCHEFGGK